jgi:hypothetical protein
MYRLVEDASPTRLETQRFRGVDALPVRSHRAETGVKDVRLRCTVASLAAVRKLEYL